MSTSTPNRTTNGADSSRVSSDDVTHLDMPGGHIGLMAGSKAKHEIWPELADWLRERSGH